MPIEDIAIYKDLGVGIVALIAIYSIAKWTGERAFKEVDSANKYMIDTQNRLTTFMETAYKDNTMAISEFMGTFKDFSRTKDDILSIVKDQQKLIEEQKEIIRNFKRVSEEQKEILDSMRKGDRRS